MKTSNFWIYKGAGRISISRYQPRFLPKDYAVFKALAPGAWFNKVDEAEYRRLYQEILDSLNPREVWDELHRLAGEAEPVLLCYEKPGEFCHRRIVAEWFYNELGKMVRKYAPVPKNKEKKPKPRLINTNNIVLPQNFL
jgi:hypothetical protein